MFSKYLFRRSCRVGALLLGVAALGGCVERKITIVSDPPGALVAVNDVEIGRTPVTFPFLWYGNYDVRLRLNKTEGPADAPVTKQYYLHTSRRAHAAPFEWLGVDLLAEVLPIWLKDEKIWAFSIPEVKSESDEELVRSAKALQGRLEEAVPLQTPPKGAATGPATRGAETRK